MNNIIKILSITMLLLSTNVIAKDNTSTLLLSKSGGEYKIDFLNEGLVTALQFDVNVEGSTISKSSLKSCVSGLPKTHTGSCAMQQNGKLRVLIYSDSMSVLESGALGSFNISGAKANNISIEGLLMGDAAAKQVKSDVVIDLDAVDLPVHGIIK